MSAPPEIVIVTVTKDDPQALARTFTSIASQRLALPRIVVCGDTSQQAVAATRSLVTDPLTTFLVDEGIGPYAAMNQALGMCSDRDYVWFVNAGDELTGRDATQLATWYLRRRPVWGYGPVIIVEEDGKVRKKTDTSPYSLRKHSLQSIAVCHQSVIANVGVLRRLGTFDLSYSIAADFKLLLRLGSLYTPTQWPVPLVAYRAGGLSDRNLRETIRQQSRIRRVELQLEGPRLWEHYVNHALRVGRFYARSAWLAYQRRHAVEGRK